ncbi:MAG: lysophospholipid acyltransferase family protein [Leptolyngbyaceae bacterium]|nr:lysophospholipid acyltransferase family protein [Leptolyngbyaceae bacterium]
MFISLLNVIQMSSSLAVLGTDPASIPVQSWISPWLTPFAYPLLRHAVVPSFFGTITITGQHHLPQNGPVILAPTHRSRWDALVVPYATGRPVTGRDIRFMVSASEMVGLQGWFIRRLGGFPVNQQQPAVASLRLGLEILKQGEMMVIFPEGGIFRDRHLHPLKPGLARLALQAETSTPHLGVRIVPLDIQYGEPMPQQGTTVTVTIGQPLVVADYCHPAATAIDLKTKAKELTTDLAQALHQLNPYTPANSALDPA